MRGSFQRRILILSFDNKLVDTTAESLLRAIIIAEHSRHMGRIWGSENSGVVIEQQRDSPKRNVWCRIMRERIIGRYILPRI